MNGFNSRVIINIFFFTILINSSCGKGGGTAPPPPPNPCNGITVVVSGSVTHPSATGASNGSISVTATGGSGFTFNNNGGAFQSSGTFASLSAGTYLIIAKNSNGCTGSASFTLTDPNSCSGVTISMGISITDNTPCQPPSGMITVAPAGGTAPYTFQLNGGTFQSSNIFSNLGAATYSITAKDANGCLGVVNNIIVPDKPTGPFFAAVRSLLDNNCVSCHNSSTAEGGMNWTVNCNVVMFKDRIKARAVDANPSSMPPTGLIPSSERKKITDWINAGGLLTD